MDKQKTDRNFDDLAHKFKKKVYGHLKGRIRLAVLENDFKEFLPGLYLQKKGSGLSILDAGCGHAPFSLDLAEMGQTVTLCDHSQNMLAIARDRIRDRELDRRVQVCNCAIQDLPQGLKGSYDLVLCHAVLEWSADPRGLIDHLLEFLRPEGVLSLTFYNLNGMIYKNLLRTNYKKIVKQTYAGWPGSLTPTNPLKPEQVLGWLEQCPTDLLCHSGMRVFHDYVLDLEDQKKAPDTVVRLEIEFSRVSPFRELGRYQHVLVKKSCPCKGSSAASDGFIDGFN